MLLLLLLLLFFSICFYRFLLFIIVYSIEITFTPLWQTIMKHFFILFHCLQSQCYFMIATTLCVLFINPNWRYLTANNATKLTSQTHRSDPFIMMKCLQFSIEPNTNNFQLTNSRWDNERMKERKNRPKLKWQRF